MCASGFMDGSAGQPLWGRGKLFRVGEDLWRTARRKAGNRGYKSDRKWHPGVSTRILDTNLNLEPVYMLQGTTHGPGDQVKSPSFLASHFDRTAPNSLTRFGNHNVFNRRWTIRKLGVPAFTFRFDPPTRSYPRLTYRNHDKPELNETEHAALEKLLAFLKKRT